MHFFLHFRKGKTQAAQSVQADPVAEKLRFSFVSSLYTDPTLRASVERCEEKTLRACKSSSGRQQTLRAEGAS
jgi:hypothetical protein